MKDTIYTNNYTTNSFKYSTQDLLKNVKRLEWLRYEVDPEWARFCSFGPEDIGGPWEKLGIIRRRPHFDTIALEKRAIEAIDSKFAKDLLEHQSPLFGMNVVESPVGNYMVSTDFYDTIRNPARCIKFYGS